MANLVSPGYKNSVLINSLLSPVDEQIMEFKGLNRRSYKEDGEMEDMLNLSAEDYPLLSPRKSRTRVRIDSSIVRPFQIISRYGRLAMLATDSNEDVYFWFDGVKRTAVTGLSTSSRMVAINTKICFFPDKTYIEIIPNGTSYTVGSFGKLDEEKKVTGATFTYGTDYCTIPLGAANSFKADDAISLAASVTFTDTNNSSVTKTVNTSCLIESASSASPYNITIATEVFDLTDADTTKPMTITATFTRSMGSITLDHVIEWNNRLWGASNDDNTIYACKLGDPTNWQYFQGTSLDSYYASQGTDGAWSGVAAYSGHLIFFKPNGMCRIYGTAPSNYQITNTKCYGVEDGSALSVVTINDVVYYKSLIGIMAYSGGTPVCISEKLTTEFANVVAGSEGSKYYATIQKKANEDTWELVVFDIEKGIWLKEDSFRFRSTCAVNNRLYVSSYEGSSLVCSDTLYCDPYLVEKIENSQGALHIINPVERDYDYKDLTEWNYNDDTNLYEPEYETIPWRAVFGPFHEYLDTKKIYSKLTLRLKANEDSSAAVYIAIDGGDWELVKEYPHVSTKGEKIPIIPRRCDNYSIKVEGEGGCEIVSLTRHVRKGSYGEL